MYKLILERLNPQAAEKIKPFLEEILGGCEERIHSIHVTGTAVTDDFDGKSSDINSIFVLKGMDLGFLELIAPLGKKYGKKRISAPLIMTPEYIKKSLDVFPVEFMNFRLVHATVFGEDILKDVEINRMDLRHQCERDLKTKLIWLRQGYISSLGDRKILTQNLANSFSGYIPLLRGIIALLGKEPPIRHDKVVAALSEAVSVNMDIFFTVMREKRENIKLSLGQLNTIFEDYYAATERLEKIVDGIKE